MREAIGEARRESPGSARNGTTRSALPAWCFNEARRESPGSGRGAGRRGHADEASMRPGANRRDQVTIDTMSDQQAPAASMRPGANRRISGTLRSVLWRRHLLYLLRALASDALNAICRRPLTPTSPLDRSQRPRQGRDRAGESTPPKKVRCATTQTCQRSRSARLAAF